MFRYSYLVVLIFRSFVDVSNNLSTTLGDCHFRQDLLNEDETYLSLTLSEGAQLFAAPGTKHNIGLLIHISEYLEGVNIYLSYREEFGGSGSNHRQHHHAELVRRLDPRLIRNVTPNVTLEATLSLDIPGISQCFFFILTLRATERAPLPSNLGVKLKKSILYSLFLIDHPSDRP